MSKTPSSETVDDLLERLFDSGGMHALALHLEDDYYTTSDDIKPDQAKASLRQAIEGMLYRVIGVNELEASPDGSKQYQGRMARNSLRNKQRERAAVQINKLFGKE